MAVQPTAASEIQPGDVYLFSDGTQEPVKRVHRTAGGDVRVVFCDPAVRYGPCAADSLHEVLRA